MHLSTLLKFMQAEFIRLLTMISPLGKIVFGVGCGIITMAIRLFGSLPEGVSYSILTMNFLVPIIDKYITTFPLCKELPKIFKPDWLLNIISRKKEGKHSV